MPVPVNAHSAYDIDLSEIQQDYEADAENVVTITDQLAKVTETMAKGRMEEDKVLCVQRDYRTIRDKQANRDKCPGRPPPFSHSS